MKTLLIKIYIKGQFIKLKFQIHNMVLFFYKEGIEAEKQRLRNQLENLGKEE